jgi:hypothetical protein
LARSGSDALAPASNLKLLIQAALCAGPNFWNWLVSQPFSGFKLTFVQTNA